MPLFRGIRDDRWGVVVAMLNVNHTLPKLRVEEEVVVVVVLRRRREVVASNVVADPLMPLSACVGLEEAATTGGSDDTVAVR